MATCLPLRRNPRSASTFPERKAVLSGRRWLIPAVYVPGAHVWHHVPPEDCTPAWALHRQYRVWVANGLTEKLDYDGPRWRSVPRWMWRHVLSLRVRALAAGLNPNPENRFQARAMYQQWRGRIRGLQMQAEAAVPHAANR